MRFTLYRTLTLTGWQWRWRLKAKNGRTIAHSGESYHNRADALAMIHEIRRNAAYGKIAGDEA